jgi:site-specific recombinase XerD
VCHSSNGLGYRNVTILLLLLDSGIRVSELVSICLNDINLAEGYIKVSLASAALNTETQDWVRTKTSEILEKMPGINGVEVSFVEAKLTKARITKREANTWSIGFASSSLVAGVGFEPTTFGL